MSKPLSDNGIELEEIESNPYQPRTTYDHERLRQQASSIEKVGLLNPILVRTGS